MRNPVQEYSLARSMPIKALAAVLQGTSDMVSLIAAHTVLREKMEAVVAEKGMQAMQMAQAPKVKDKDLAMAQGLGASPADIDVPMGGIVGGEGTFGTGAAGGGSVVAFQEGGQLELPFDDPRRRAMMSTRTPGAGVSFSQAFADRDIPKKNFVERGLGALRNMPYAGKAFRLASSPMAATAQLGLTSPDLNVGEEEYLALIKKLANMGYPAEMIEAMSPEQRVAAAQGKLPTGQADTGGVPTQTLAQMEAAQAAPPQGAAAPPAPTGGIADLATAQTQVAQPTSFEAVTNQAKELAKKYKTDSGTTKDFTAFSKEYVDTLKNAGYDFDLVKNNISKLAEEKETLKGERKEATNLRLLEAGLGILGGESPYAFVNIGKGATPALQGLAKDIKDIKKTRRELDKETMQLNLLQNQMAEGKVKYAQGRLDKQEDRAAKAAEKNAEIEFRIADRMSSNSIQKYVADRQTETSRINLQATQLDRTAAREATLAENAEKRDAAYKKAAIEQAAEDVKLLPAEQQAAEKRKRAKQYYDMFKAKEFGAESGSDLSQWGTPKVKN
jgi:hypothetical protein